MGDGTPIKKLVVAAIIVVALAVVTLMGIAVTSEYSYTLRDSTTVNINTSNIVSVLAPANTSNAIGTTGQYPFLQDLDNCFNGSIAHNPLVKDTDYVIAEGSADGGTLTLLEAASNIWNGSSINCSTLTYLADSDAQGAADKFTSGLAIFASFLGVLVLALMGKAILGLFRAGKA